MDCLIHHPHVGSLWLTNCKIENGYVNGLAWNDDMAGSPYYPDDYSGEYEMMNFPETCIVKREVFE
jgi:hypothetical protein